MATADMTRDLDVLRQAVGDRKLTYAGYSYGPFPGKTYANIFPDNVRAIVIDGFLDPIAWTTGGAAAPRFRSQPGCAATRARRQRSTSSSGSVTRRARTTRSVRTARRGSLPSQRGEASPASDHRPGRVDRRAGLLEPDRRHAKGNVRLVVAIVCAAAGRSGGRGGSTAPTRRRFKSPGEALDTTTTTPGGRLVFHVFALLAEFICGLIVEAPRRDWTPPAPATCASGGRRP